jgi:hypothetical protein
VNRAERRRQARSAERRRDTVLIAGEGIVAASLGMKYEATGHAELPEKIAGKHRWIATGAWVLRDIDVEKAHDADTMKFLDNENLYNLSIGCWDCEQPIGAIEFGSTCPAGAT